MCIGIALWGRNAVNEQHLFLTRTIYPPQQWGKWADEPKTIGRLPISYHNSEKAL